MKRSYQYSDYEQEYKKNIKIVEKFDKDYLDSFQSNIYSLNSNLVDLIKEKIKENPSIDLSGIFSNFLSYLNYIEKNYLLPPKNTYSFGSGDCGQLAHGVENDKDMLVKYPRKVLSLEGKNLVNVSCGGLHNAAVTSSGEVYTWGCADDGSLGRVAGEDGVFAEDIPTPIKVINFIYFNFISFLIFFFYLYSYLLRFLKSVVVMVKHLHSQLMVMSLAGVLIRIRKEKSGSTLRPQLLHLNP